MRYPWRRPVPVHLPAPLPEELVAEFRDRPFGSHGETVGHVQPTVEPLPGGRYQVPPVDWEQEAAERTGCDELSSSSSAEPASHATAGETMFAAALERGEIDEPVPLGPPVIYPPLQRPSFPAPDWRAEQEAAQARSEP